MKTYLSRRQRDLLATLYEIRWLDICQAINWIHEILSTQYSLQLQDYNNWAVSNNYRHAYIIRSVNLNKKYSRNIDATSNGLRNLSCFQILIAILSRRPSKVGQRCWYAGLIAILRHPIRNLLWSLSDKGTRVRFCWIPSHCGIDGNERVDQLAKETLDQDIDPLASAHYTDMKSLVNSYIQKLVQTKWDVAIHGRYLYLVKPTLWPPKKFQHLTRAEEVIITRLRIGHTKATKSHILSRGTPTGCHHCGQTLTIDHTLLECALLQECSDEHYTADSLIALFETIPETCIVEFLREAGFFYLLWCNLLTSTSPQTWTI